MFTYQTIVKLHQTDAAGRLFFGEQFKMMHDAYEAWLETLGFGFLVILKKKNYFLPIVHAQADYKKILYPGDRITIEMELEKAGTSSLVLAFRIFDQRRAEVGSGKTVHVSVSQKTGKKIPLPTEIRDVLKRISREMS